MNSMFGINWMKRHLWPKPSFQGPGLGRGFTGLVPVEKELNKLIAILESTQTLPTQLPFKGGKILRLLIQAKLAFEASDEAYFIFWTTKVESVQQSSREQVGTARMDMSSEVFMMFPQWAESSLVHPMQKQSLWSSVSPSLSSHAPHGLLSPPGAPLPSPSPAAISYLTLCCLLSQRVFCPLKFPAPGLACWGLGLAY